MSAANGIFQGILTTLRGRKILNGSFVTANTAAPTTPLGDAKSAIARTGVGTFTVTLPKKYGTCESLTFSITGAAQSVSASYSPTTGIITFQVSNVSGGTAAETTGLTVNWTAVFSDRSN